MLLTFSKSGYIKKNDLVVSATLRLNKTNDIYMSITTNRCSELNTNNVFH